MKVIPMQDVYGIPANPGAPWRAVVHNPTADRLTPAILALSLYLLVLGALQPTQWYLYSTYVAYGVFLVAIVAFLRPVLATPVGAIPEMLLDGQCGWLFPVEDVKALTEKIRELLANPREQAQKQDYAKAHILQHYNESAQQQAFNQSIDFYPTYKEA